MNNLNFNLNFQVKIDENFKKILEKKYLKITKNVLEILSFKDKRFFDVTFVSLNKIQEINKKRRNIDKPTDVISFSFWDYEQFKTPLLGDIFICYKFCVEEAKQNNWSLEYEFCLMFTHGLLHLLRYDHATKEQEKIMFDLTDKILEKVVKKIK